MNTKKHILSVFIFLGFSLNAVAQFTHVEADLGYQYIRFSALGLYESDLKTKTNVATLSLTAVQRPTRFIGAGLTIGIPLVSNTKWTFYELETTNGRDYTDYDNTFSSSNNFSPDNYDYNIQHSPSVTLFARLFFKPEARINIDFRYTFINLKETFIFERTGRYPVSIDHSDKRSAKGPGMAFLYKKIYDNGLYIKYQYSFDYLTVESSSAMNYAIIYTDDQSSGTDAAIFNSLLNDNHIMHNWIFGFGYYF